MLERSISRIRCVQFGFQVNLNGLLNQELKCLYTLNLQQSNYIRDEKPMPFLGLPFGQMKDLEEIAWCDLSEPSPNLPYMKKIIPAGHISSRGNHDAIEFS